MNNTFTVQFSNLNIEVQSRYQFMQDFCRDYITDYEPEFSVQADPSDVARQMSLSSEPTTIEYAEALQLYREMAERLPAYGRAVFHGAAIEYEGQAYLFSGPSGVGKTTHINLWRHYLGEKVGIINGDKPILLMENDNIIVCGNPYAGKEGWHRNVSYPLAGICLLSQGDSNTIIRLSQEQAFTQLYQQIYRPHGADAIVHTIEILRQLASVPCYQLTCDISQSAVSAAFTALIGNEYTEK